MPSNFRLYWLDNLLPQNSPYKQALPISTSACSLWLPRDEAADIHRSTRCALRGLLRIRRREWTEMRIQKNFL